MYKKFKSFIQFEHLLDNIQHIDIALSGGADSVCLTALLSKYRDEQKPELSLRAHHIRHGLRDSDIFDAEIARQTAEKFKIPFIQTNLNLGSVNDNIEETARNARYEALFGEIRKLNYGKASICLALAHHGDENIETALWRLGRGCGLEGLTLSAKRHIQDLLLIRPLLCLSKTEIYAWLKNNGITWAEDPTNQSDHYLRNRIRHDILPPLIQSASKPDCIYQSLINIRHDTDALDSFADYFVQSHPTHFNGWFCRYTDWDFLKREAQIQVLRHVARHVLTGHGITQDFVFKSLAMIEKQNPSHRIYTDEKISVGFCKIGIMVWNNQRPNLPTPIKVQIPAQDLNIWDLYKVSVLNVQLKESLKNTTTQLFISTDSINPNHLTIYPAGCFKSLTASDGRTTRTSEALRSQGVPDIWRNYWPVLCDDEGPLWIIGGMRTERAKNEGAAYTIAAHVRRIGDSQ